MSYQLLEEDEGWVLCIVHDENSDKSKFLIIDARDFEGPPVATVNLPQRVPYGAHGSWMPDPA
jgi:carotenoid cleavage dioxygenase